MARPKINLNAVADQYAEKRIERIAEFNDGTPGGKGGLISLRRMDDETLRVDVYRTDPGVTVVGGLPAGAADFACAECGTTTADTYVVTGPANETESRTEVCLPCHRTLDVAGIAGKFTGEEVNTLLNLAAELRAGVEPDDLYDEHVSLLDRLTAAWQESLGIE